MASSNICIKIEIKDKKLEVTREIDEGLETIEINVPAIVTCDLRLNEPRYASLPNIMKAKKKPIEQIKCVRFRSDTKPRIEQIKVEEPPKRKAGIKVSSVAELVQKLKNEAKGNIMSVLLIAEHNNKELNLLHLNAVTAASQIDKMFML